MRRMNELMAAFLTYAILMTFTPGPNNVSSSALGLRVGYRESLPYLFGIATGFLVIMLCGGFLTELLTRNYATMSPYLKWIGALYMAWLAVSLFIHSSNKKAVTRDGYAGGFVLQFLNPKGILYGITVYVSFPTILTGSIGKTLASAVFLTALGFASISTWALVGSVLSRSFAQPSFRLTFNIIMALLLAYSAISILLH
jgi:cysteine/O-acetylserine efflux protein